MRTSAVRKIHYAHVKSTRASAEVFDFDKLGRMQVATEAAIAGHQVTNAPDFEEFMNKYNMKTAGFFE